MNRPKGTEDGLAAPAQAPDAGGEDATATGGHGTTLAKASG
jgi:hypothetical protein